MKIHLFTEKILNLKAVDKPKKIFLFRSTMLLVNIVSTFSDIVGITCKLSLSINLFRIEIIFFNTVCSK
jgi:hypothetical protein